MYEKKLINNFIYLVFTFLQNELLSQMHYQKTANVVGIFSTSRLVTFVLLITHFFVDTMCVDSREVTVYCLVFYYF